MLADVDGTRARSPPPSDGRRLRRSAWRVTWPTRTRSPALVDRTVDTYGRLDVAFNNAGIMLPPSDAADEPAEAFDRVNAVNLRGVWACMKHELRLMREQGSGAIVNCSSLGGLVGFPGRAAYHATKHGVIGLTKSARWSTRRAASASTRSARGRSRRRWSRT